MSNDLIEAARRAEGSEVLPGVMLGNYRADALIAKMAARIEALEAENARLTAEAIIAALPVRRISTGMICECGMIGPCMSASCKAPILVKSTTAHVEVM